MPNPNPPGWMKAPYAGSGWATNEDMGIAAAAMSRQWFGAIAYSTSTGRYGWSTEAPDRATAERLALEHCESSDAQIVVWGTNAFLALAVADDRAYGWAWDEDRSAAEERALHNCAGANGRIVLSFDTRQA